MAISTKVSVNNVKTIKMTESELKMQKVIKRIKFIIISAILIATAIGGYIGELPE